VATDRFSAATAGLGSPADDGAAVTPNDGADLAFVTKGLFVGGAGNLAVTTAQGNALTFTGLLAGTLLPIRVSRVKATGTTATNIVALF